MSSLKKIEMTVDFSSGRIIDTESNEYATNRGVYKKLFLREDVVLCLHFMDTNGNNAVFDVSDRFEAAVDDNFIHTDRLMAFSDSDSVNLTGDWDEADLSQGRISIRMNFRSATFREKLGDGESLQAFLEIKRFSDNGKVGIILLDRVLVSNIVNVQNAPPEDDDVSFYYKKDEIDVKFTDLENSYAALVHTHNYNELENKPELSGFITYTEI